MNPKIIDDLAKRLADAIPETVTDLQQDVKKNIFSILQNTFAKLNLVTREEFDVQNKVLANTRVILSQLEEQVAQLEAQLDLSQEKRNNDTHDAN